MELGLKGKKVLIVGGSKGLGKAAAIAFAKEAASVGLIGRSEDDLRIASKEAGGAAFVVADLTKEGEIVRALRELEEKTREFDVVVNVVGGPVGARDPLSSIEEWEAAWKLNVGVAIEVNNILVPKMQKKKWGRVVNIASISGEHLLGDSLYSVSKAFLINYSKVLARTVAKDGVVVSTISPGAFTFPGGAWDKKAKEDPKRLEWFLDEHMAGKRLGTPEEIVPFILLLSSEQASFASGAAINIDGGTM